MLQNDDLSLPGMNPRPTIGTPGLLRRILTIVVGIVAVAGVIAVSMVLLIAIAFMAALAGIYLWWKRRALRRQLGERPRAGARIIEGEVIPEHPES
jgi:hypothetical protein